MSSAISTVARILKKASTSEKFPESSLPEYKPMPKVFVYADYEPMPKLLIYPEYKPMAKVFAYPIVKVDQTTSAHLPHCSTPYHLHPPAAERVFPAKN